MSHTPPHRASRIHQKVVIIGGKEVVQLVDENGNPVHASAHTDVVGSGGGDPLSEAAQNERILNAERYSEFLTDEINALKSQGGGTTSGGLTMDQLYDAVVALQGMITDNKTASDAFANAANNEITAIKARLDALEAG